MNQLLKFTACTLLSLIATFISCKKEHSCENCKVSNKPPIANAGAEQTINLPKDSLVLDATASTDPDGTITIYNWIQISGPALANIIKPDSAKTSVIALVSGVYYFQLTVTDNGGLTAKATVQVNVTAEPVVVTSLCGTSNRPLINAQLIPVGKLSQTRTEIAVAAASNKILWAGGYTTASGQSSRVDIFDITTNVWSTTELSEVRRSITPAVAGNKIFFAGGGNSTRVDVYDALANKWSTWELSTGRSLMASTTVGNKVFFAGGRRNASATGSVPYGNTEIDIYDISNNLTNTANLAGGILSGRHNMSGTTVGTKVYFAGGTDPSGNFYPQIDIYDNATNTWSTSNLQFVEGGISGIAVGNINYWAGWSSSFPTMSQVEIRNEATGASTFECLSYNRDLPGAVLKDNKIVFFTGFSPTGSNKFDIYDITTKQWSIGVLPVSINEASVISVNNTIYVAAGFVNGVLSQMVWKLDF